MPPGSNFFLEIKYSTLIEEAHQSHHKSTGPHVQTAATLAILHICIFLTVVSEVIKNKLSLLMPWRAKSYPFIYVDWLICRLIIRIPSVDYGIIYLLAYIYFRIIC